MAILKLLGCAKQWQQKARQFTRMTKTLNYNAGIRSFSTAPSSAHFPTRLNRENIDDFMGSFDTMLTDCDGVLWGCDMLTNFENIGPTMDMIRENGTRVIFVSNNSLFDRYEFQRKFKRLSNFHAEVDDIYAVNYVTAVYMKEALKVAKCYLIGTMALERELTDLGIECIGLGPDEDAPCVMPQDIISLRLDPQVAAVCASFDEHFSYNKLVKASSYLRDEHVRYVATCEKEMTIPLDRHWTQPLTGTIVQAVSSASNRQPIVIGKPSFTMLECIMRQNIDVDLDRTIMVGDSLKSDIAFAKCAKIPSLLVLSGSTTYEKLCEAHENDEPMPEYYTEKLSDLLELMDDEVVA